MLCGVSQRAVMSIFIFYSQRTVAARCRQDLSRNPLKQAAHRWKRKKNDLNLLPSKCILSSAVRFVDRGKIKMRVEGHPSGIKPNRSR